MMDGKEQGRKRGRWKMGRMARHEERVAFLFLAPWLVGLVIFWIGPIIASAVISMTEWYIIESPKWVGLANYREMFTKDRQFAQSIGVTLKYTAMSLPVYLAAGLGLSLLLNLKIRGMNVYRTILFIPAVLSGVAVASIPMLAQSTTS
jgi:multiple sugar transport system permease protein